MKEKSKKVVFSHPSYEEIPPDAADITAIYIRVSTDVQAREGYGIDAQYAEIKRYLDAYGIENAYVFADDGYTGTNEDRPAFSAMTKLMNEGKVKLVVTRSLDRIGRTQMIILRFLKEQCEKTKCDFYAVKDNVDSRSRQTYGILISILSIFAEFDHDAIVSKLAAGRVRRAADGYWKGGGIPPYGYRYSAKDGELQVDLEQAARVRKVFQLYLSNGFSPRKIADALGFSSDVAVSNILKNRIYLGEISYRGESYKGRHQAIIDQETFLRAEEQLRLNGRTRGRATYLLSSLLFCGRCGSRMRYMKWGDGKTAKLKIFCYARFPKSSKKYLVKSDVCDNIIFDAREVESAVVKSVMRFAVKFGDDNNKSNIGVNEVIEGLTATRERLSAQYSRLLTAYKRIGDEDILEQAASINKKIKKIDRDIDAEKEKGILSERLNERAAEMRTLPDAWKTMDDEKRRRLLLSVIEKVVLTPETIEARLNESQFEKTIDILDEIDYNSK